MSEACVTYRCSSCHCTKAKAVQINEGLVKMTTICWIAYIYRTV